MQSHGYHTFDTSLKSPSFMCYFTSFWAGVLINLKTLLYPITESVTEDKLLFLSSKDTKSIQMNSPNGKYSGEGSLQRL